MAETKERFRLRNMNVTRVDLVDRGANQKAHIKLAKRDDSVAKNEKNGYSDPAKKQGLAERLSAMLGGGQEEAAPGASPLARPKGQQQRIVRLRPEDFEITEVNGNMMEWAIPEDKLPEGVEEAIMTMAQSAETVMFQWMIDPLAGPPVEGQAKTAAEAFMAMRAALTTRGAMDPMSMLGGLPGQQKPGAAPTNQKDKEPSPMAKAITSVRQQRVSGRAPVTAEETLNTTLDLIAKGLVEVDIFNETATGADLRDILPQNLLVELTKQLSATQSAE